MTDLPSRAVKASAAKVGEVDSSEDDLNPSECLALDYQPREGVPGFEVETVMSYFGHPLPIGHKNASRHLLTPNGLFLVLAIVPITVSCLFCCTYSGMFLQYNNNTYTCYNCFVYSGLAQARPEQN